MPDPIAPFPKNEFERLLKLADYDIDYSEIHGKLDDLTQLAAHVAGTPISLINLLGKNTQWTVSKFGLDIHQTPREDTVCQYAVLQNTPLEIEDLSKDERFREKGYASETGNIHYYYGVPLTTPDGFNIGAMCVMDTGDHQLTPDKEKFLKIIANEVITRIEYEHQLKLMHCNVNELKEIQRKISHDIRGPIGGIIGIAEILRDQAKESKMEEFMDSLELINKSGRSVLELAEDILANYSEYDFGEQQEVNHLTLPQLKQKLEDLYLPQAKAKNITYNVHTGGGFENLSFPKHKLMQIFGNLISNAIKFTPQKGKVEVELNIRKSPRATLVAKVTDNGVGMSKDQIQKIQSDTAGTTAGTGNERGYGFGLRLVKHLLVSLKGDLVIESSQGKGAEITVKIPLT